MALSPIPALFSVCIPAYNRAALLPDLLDSIFQQDFDDLEVVISEDHSPERDRIRAIAAAYAQRYPGKLRYHENDGNLGYDRNLRKLVQLATGDFVVFMGNDDLMCPGALRHVAGALQRHTGLGVILRAYAAFDGTPENVVQTFRYFDRELLFPSGAATISTIYRRSVVISGMILHRQSAVQAASDRFDGTLLYQLYLVAEILVERQALYLPDIIVLYRNGGIPDFGTSAAERGRFQPRTQTPASSLHFLAGMLDIAHYVERHRSVAITDRIIRDIANYSYPFLAIQAQRPLAEFIAYGRNLSRMGLGRYPLFWLYWLALLLFGPARLDRAIARIKARLGRTPVLGRVYQGGVE